MGITKRKDVTPMKKRVCGLLAAIGISLTLTACVAEPAEGRQTPETSASTTTTTTGTTAAPLPSVGYCTADPSMHVRVAPGPYEEVIGGLARGEQVQIVGKEGDWYRIAFKDGFAYVSAQYIADTPPSETTTADTTASTTAETAVSDPEETTAALSQEE